MYVHTCQVHAINRATVHDVHMCVLYMHICTYVCIHSTYVRMYILVSWLRGGSKEKL